VNVRRNTALLAASLAANTGMLQLNAAIASITLVLVVDVEGLLGLGPAIVLAAGAPELVDHTDRAAQLAEDAAGRDAAVLRAAVDLVEDTRARLVLNVSYELACEALAYRLERSLS